MWYIGVLVVNNAIEQDFKRYVVARRGFTFTGTKCVDFNSSIITLIFIQFGDSLWFSSVFNGFPL